MLKTIFFYGLILGGFVLLLHFSEYFFLVRTHIFEVYGGLIAILFLGLGLWFGNKLQSKKAESTVNEPIANTNFSELGISKREFEVLQLLSQGLSNQEIADSLFVSMNTIKTHTSRLFEKLEVKNRTQALIKAKEKGLIL
jgi:DNA-binding CsgD family transcriptional regulator